jgi:hypothetical protein
MIHLELETIDQINNSMRATEFITEATRPPPIEVAMRGKGYTFLGSGVEQTAYLAPDGTVLKLFPSDWDNRLSKGQLSFIEFANYCQAHPDNPFLPQFGGWEKFKYDDTLYLQIRSERLFPFMSNGSLMLDRIATMTKNNSIEKVIDAISNYSTNLTYGGNVDDKDSWLSEVVTLLGGKEELILFVKTIKDLAEIAKRKRYKLDLHRENFMLGSDGEIVINDPFWSGD